MECVSASKSHKKTGTRDWAIVHSNQSVMLAASTQPSDSTSSRPLAKVHDQRHTSKHYLRFYTLTDFCNYELTRYVGSIYMESWQCSYVEAVVSMEPRCQGCELLRILCSKSNLHDELA